MAKKISIGIVYKPQKNGVYLPYFSMPDGKVYRSLMLYKVQMSELSDEDLQLIYSKVTTIKNDKGWDIDVISAVSIVGHYGLPSACFDPPSEIRVSAFSLPYKDTDNQ